MTFRTTIRSLAVSAGLGLTVPATVSAQTPLTIPPADAVPTAAPEPTSVPAAKPTPVGKVTASPRNPSDSVTALPQMLSDARTAYAKVRDYVCHYIRQEKVSGRLVPEQKCVLRVRTEPFSVAVQVVGPKEYAGRETSFVSGRNTDKVWFKPANSQKTVRADMDDPRVILDTRHTIVDTGIQAVLDRVERSVRIEQRLNNPVQVLVADYSLAGRKCTRYEIFCDRPHVLRYAARHVIFIDDETKLPARYEAYAQPSPGGVPGGDLIEAQSFLGMKLNQGIGDAAFVR